MCGIIGYLSWKKLRKDKTVEIILEALEKLEYRGYDSAGIAIIDIQGQLNEYKCIGSPGNLKVQSVEGKIGIGHTRWATHGSPTLSNTHPHHCGNISIVHNGIIENYQELIGELSISNFESETDTEVLGWYLSSDINNIPKLTEKLNRVRGTFGLCIMDLKDPQKLIAIRRGSPIIIGKSKEEYFVCSDVYGMNKSVESYFHLTDNQLAICRPGRLEVYDLNTNVVVEPIFENLEIGQTQKCLGNFKHFLEKEIFDQPKSLETLFQGRLTHQKIHIGGMIGKEYQKIKNLWIFGCGSAYHAGLCVERLYQGRVDLSIRTFLASEFKDQKIPPPPNTLAVFISQSGETADTLSVVKFMKGKCDTFGVINVIGSTIAREVESGIYIHAGPEFSVASTKAFTNQVVGLSMILHYICHLDYHNFLRLPEKVNNVLSQNNMIKEIANNYKDLKNALILGRGNLWSVALEGALKIKEVSYIHAEGLSASELKHGSIALLDETFFVVYLLSEGDLYEKSLNNLNQVLSRMKNKNQVLVITDSIEFTISEVKLIKIDSINSTLEQTITFNVVLQLLAYHLANAKGLPIDKPRNLAKSVTVE